MREREEREREREREREGGREKGIERGVESVYVREINGGIYIHRNRGREITPEKKIQKRERESFARVRASERKRERGRE